MYKDLIESFESRKFRLLHMLQEGKVDHGKKHQLYGAVCELDLVLQALQQQHSLYMEQQEKMRYVDPIGLEREHQMKREQLQEFYTHHVLSDGFFMEGRKL